MSEREQLESSLVVWNIIVVEKKWRQERKLVSPPGVCVLKCLKSL